MEKNSELDILKKDYKKIQKKYNLPEFEKLNKDFSIERLADVETDFLIRNVRRTISEKINAYTRIIETFLQPSNGPLYIFSIVKLLNTEKKKILSEIYKKLARMEIDIFEIDIDFSEEKEADFINKAYSIWQEIKKDLLEIIKFIKENLETKSEFANKSYFN